MLTAFLCSFGEQEHILLFYNVLFVYNVVFVVWLFLSSSFFVSSSCFISFCNVSMSLPICSQLFESFDSVKLLFALIICSSNPSIVLLSSTLTLTLPVGDNRFWIAFIRLSPIAILFPDATTTFFSTGTLFVSFSEV